MTRTKYPLPVVPQPEGVRMVCVPVPDEPFHIAAFLGAIYNLSRWYSWRQDEAHTALDAAAMWLPIYRQVAAALESGDGCGTGGQMLLRQNPADNCQLQFSNDDGDTWHLAFDYGLCTPGWAAPLVAQNAATQPPSPYAPAETWIWSEGEPNPQVEQRQLALCDAARVVVNLAMDMYLQAQLEQLTVQAAAAITLGILTIINPLIGAGLWAAFGTGVAFGTLSLITLYEGVITHETASDPDIREYFACHLIAALSGRPVTLLDFQAAFSDADVCTSEPYTSVAHYLYELFGASAQSEALYHQFLRVLGDTTLAVQSGQTPEECGCPEETWCHLFTGTELAEYATVLDDRFSYFDGSGLLRSYSRPDLGCVPVCAMATAKIGFYVPPNTTITGAMFHFCDGANNLGSKAISDNYGVSSSANPGDDIIRIANPGTYSRSGQWLEFTFGRYMNNYVDWLCVDKFWIFGTGQRLFGSCDNC